MIFFVKCARGYYTVDTTPFSRAGEVDRGAPFPKKNFGAARRITELSQGDTTLFSRTGEVNRAAPF